jgi:hypothetical protein
MEISKINVFNAILIILFLLLVVNVSAETTFFDNPDGTFIIINATTGTVIEGITGGTIIGGGCTYNWSCTGWSGCINGIQTRTCTNLGSCFDNKGKPIESQSCTSLKNIAPPTVTTKTSEEPKAPSTMILLGLVVGLIAVIAISTIITAIILKKRK